MTDFRQWKTLQGCAQADFAGIILVFPQNLPFVLKRSLWEVVEVLLEISISPPRILTIYLLTMNGSFP